MSRIFTGIAFAAVLAPPIGFAQNTANPRLKANCPEVQWEPVAAEGSARILYYMCVPVTPAYQKLLDANGGSWEDLCRSAARLQCESKGYNAGTITYAYQQEFDQLPLSKKVPTVAGSEADGTMYFPSVVECLKK